MVWEGSDKGGGLGRFFVDFRFLVQKVVHIHSGGRDSIIERGWKDMKQGKEEERFENIYSSKNIWINTTVNKKTTKNNPQHFDKSK